MKCLILAAGYATRLYPLTENFPKPLLKVGDKCILDWLMEDLSGQISEYIVVSNHKFVDHFRQWAEGRDEKITVLDDGTTTNEGRLGAVKDMLLALKGNTEEVLVMAGDNLLDFSLKGFIAFYGEKQAPCIMTYEENRIEKQKKSAIIEIADGGLITGFEEKPANPRSNHAVPAFYIYRPQDTDMIEPALEAGCGFDAPGSFAGWLSKKTDMYAWNMPGKRYDIGDAASYAQVQQEYRGITK